MEEEYKESELSKIVKKLMDEEGYEFGEAVKEAIKKGYAYGGGVGHLLEPTQTYHQYHDFTAPMTVGAMVDNMYNRGGRVNYKKGGRGRQDRMGGTMEQTAAELRAVNPAEFGGGMNISYGGGNDGNNNPPVVIKNEPPVIPQDDKVEQNLITGKWMTNADLATKQKFLNYIDQNKSFNLGQDVDADTLYANYLEATGLDKHNKNVLVDSETINQRKEVDGNTIFDTRTTDETFKDLDKDWTTRNTTVTDTAGNTTTNRLTPAGMWENDVYLGNRAPQSMAIDPPKSFDLPGNNLRTEVTDIDLKRAKEPMTKMLDYDTYKSINPGSKISPYEFDELKKGNITETGTFTAADGGRVGMFMGGDPLTGQALSIYESMNSYGFSDAEIASALQQQGLYTPPGSGTPTPDPTPDPTPGQGGGQGGGDGGGIMELQKTYSTLPGDPKNFRLSQLEGTSDYFPPTTGMGKAKNWFQEKFFQPKVKGTLGTRLANQPRLPLPLSMAAYARSPFNPESATYNPNFESQLNFLEGLSGTKLSGNWKNATKFDEFGKPIEFGIIEGQSMIGRDPNTGGLKYGPGSVLEGKNVISGFGSNNYETALNKYISRMLRYENPTKFQAAKLQKARDELAAYKTQQKEKDIIDQKENLANATAIQKATIAARGREGGSGGRMVDRRTGAMKGYEQGAGGGKDAASEHFYIKDGGIAQYAPKKKGIASMFTRRR